DPPPSGAIEYSPHEQVVAEVFEVMVDSGGYEEKVTRLERISHAIVEQDASTADDDVDLVLCMRRLFVGACRRRELHVERAVAENALATRSAFDVDHATRCGHAPIPLSGRLDGEELPLSNRDEARREIGVRLDERDEWGDLLRVGQDRIVHHEQSTWPEHAPELGPPAQILGALGAEEQQV